VRKWNEFEIKEKKLTIRMWTDIRYQYVEEANDNWNRFELMRRSIRPVNAHSRIELIRVTKFVKV
jgi:hypothetical protein